MFFGGKVNTILQVYSVNKKKKKEKKVAGRYLSIQETDSKDGFLFQAAGS